MTTCEIAGCSNPHRARGWCTTHYMRWYKTGDPLQLRPERWDGYVRPVCSVSDCESLAHAHGMCMSHLKRLQRHGDPLAGRRFIRLDLPILDRLMLLVAVTPNGCWNFTGGKTTGGYGQMDGLYTHRLSYELHTGEIPEGLTIDHTCHNRDASCPGGACAHRACINPAHLEAVTQEENLRRAKYRTLSI